MIIQTLDPNYFNQKAQQIRAHVPIALAQRGLLPKFSRWRLTQDPSSGLVVLFGVLNDKYIAAHTQIPADAYFDPRLLHDLATDLQVQVIPSNTVGLRYAFILDRGQLEPVGMVPDFVDVELGTLSVDVTDSTEPIILVWDDNLVVAGSPRSSKTIAPRVVYHPLIDDFQPIPVTATFPVVRQPLGVPLIAESETLPSTTLFARPLRYPERPNENLPSAVRRRRESLPRLLQVFEQYNDLLRTPGLSAGEFSQAASSFARIGQKWGMTVLISAPECPRS